MREFREAFNKAIEQEFALMADIDLLEYRITVLKAAATIFDELDGFDRAGDKERLIEAVIELQEERTKLSSELGRNSLLMATINHSNQRYDILNYVLTSVGHYDTVEVTDLLRYKLRKLTHDRHGKRKAARIADKKN